MPKPRTKRQAIRDERKEKRRAKESANEDHQAAKRQRREEKEQRKQQEEGEEDAGYAVEFNGRPPMPEPEFFGMLSEEDQEIFRQMDQELDAHGHFDAEFPDQESRDAFVAKAFAAAQGKELKLACSQSCSRLLERLIAMSNTWQKKRLFEAFASHFLNLMQHRFASHCCETLFLQSAPVVTKELGGERDDMPSEFDTVEDDSKQPASMEELFLLTLDELEGHMGYLMTDKFASHTLRALLIILSGRPLEQSSTKSIIHSKKKEKIEVPWALNGSDEVNVNVRPVPAVFTMAAKKIIDDSTSGMDPTSLRVLAKHPTGNPVLQLLLELDISLNPKNEGDSNQMTLLYRLLPGAPASLGDTASPASEFVGSLLYDTVGSRLLETLITNCPGKIFKALMKFHFGDRIQSLVRNDVASYPALRILNRVGKEDLVACVQKILPEVEKLVSLSRLNVIKTLFERCKAREATAEIEQLFKALLQACGSDPKSLVPKLCMPSPEKAEDKAAQASLAKSQGAQVAHGCQLVTTLLSLRGFPVSASQSSLLALTPEALADLATSSNATSRVVLAALESRSQSKVFHKALVASLMRSTMKLALSDNGSRVVSAIVSIPSKSEGIAVPFHFKEQIISELAEHEQDLRDSFYGRHVWRNWSGDMWKTRRRDWIAWAKEVDSQSDQSAPLLPWQKKAQQSLQDGNGNANMTKVDEARKRKRNEDSAQ